MTAWDGEISSPLRNTFYAAHSVIIPKPNAANAKKFLRIHAKALLQHAREVDPNNEAIHNLINSAVIKTYSSDWKDALVTLAHRMPHALSNNENNQIDDKYIGIYSSTDINTAMLDASNPRVGNGIVVATQQFIEQDNFRTQLSRKYRRATPQEFHDAFFPLLAGKNLLEITDEQHIDRNQILSPANAIA